MANILKWLESIWREPLVADLPPELAQCEDACNVGECTHDKWMSCENRIRRMQEEMRCSRDLGDDSEASVEQK